MQNIITTMQECDAIIQTLIADIGTHQVQATDLATQLRTAANLLDPPSSEYPATSVNRSHGMFQTVVSRSTVLESSDKARSLHAQLQEELDRYHQGEQEVGNGYREVEPAAIRPGNRVRILDITLHYRQWTEFVCHRIEHYPGVTGVYYLVSRDDGMRKLIYAVGALEPYLSRTYFVADEGQS